MEKSYMFNDCSDYSVEEKTLDIKIIKKVLKILNFLWIYSKYENFQSDIHLMYDNTGSNLQS